MDKIKARIKEYVMEMNPELDTDLLDMAINEIVDRILIYTNREQLIRQYEEDVVKYPIKDKSDTKETNYLYWKSYDGYPIPVELERAIARTVLEDIETLKESLAGKEVVSMTDLGQSVTFGDSAKNYFTTKQDSEILMSLRPLLDKFRIPTIVGNT
jgi:hypothetical protein